MRLDPFPLCCGIYIINDFPYEACSKKDLKEMEDKINSYFYQRSTGLYLIALNNKQKVHFKDLMDMIGFQEMVKDFYNPLHGSTIALYGKAVVGTNLAPEVVPNMTKDSIFRNFNNQHLYI